MDLAFELINFLFFTCSIRKTVGNFIAGNDNTSSDKSSQNKASGSSGAGYDERNAPHSKLPMDPYYYPGPRYSYYLMDIEVTRLGHCKYMKINWET